MSAENKLLTVFLGISEEKRYVKPPRKRLITLQLSLWFALAVCILAARGILIYPALFIMFWIVLLWIIFLKVWKNYYSLAVNIIATSVFTVLCIFVAVLL